MTHKHLDWTSAFELGIEDIDFQHHFFLNLINQLADELTQSEDLKYRAALITELNAYARFHFISEENMMYRARYPALDEHKELHHDLIDQLSTRENMLTLNQTKEYADSIVDFLTNWFIHHTLHEDRKFANYVHGKEQT